MAPKSSLPIASGPLLLAGIILLAALSRLLPHPPNFSPVEALALSSRGSWSLQLDSGAVVELGRGTPAEVLERTRRFVQTITQVTAKYARQPEALVSADLRHGNGYAVRMRGVSTTGAGAPKK